MIMTQRGTQGFPGAPLVSGQTEQSSTFLAGDDVPVE
jgi:hypothetical protein